MNELSVACFTLLLIFFLTRCVKRILIVLLQDTRRYSDDMSEERGHQWFPRRSIMNVGHAPGSEDINNGVLMWKKLVRQYTNIFMAVSGHVFNDDTGALLSEGKYGNNVYQMFVNYPQSVKGSANKMYVFLRVLTINPGKGQISVETYLPYIDKYKASLLQQFKCEKIRF